MQHNDGLRSYTAPPVGARVCEQAISEPTAVASHTDKVLAFLRLEWKGATKAQRTVIETEALELKRQAHIRDGYREETPASFGDHYDGCEGCFHPQCNGLSW